jgi:RNA recognition motif-containing protein
MMAGGFMGGMGQQRRGNNMPMQNMANPIPGFNQMLLAPKQKREYDNSCSLYVGNLTATTFDNDLFKFFSSKGYKLKTANVMIDMSTKRSKCFGYLNFYSKEEASRCQAEMNNAICDGKQIVLNKKKESDFDSEANVLVKNIPKEMT